MTSVVARLGMEAVGGRRTGGGGLKESQRAVLMCPGSPEAWAALVAAQLAAGHSQVILNYILFLCLVRLFVIFLHTGKTFIYCT